MKKISDMLYRISVWAVSILVGLMTGVVILDVAARNIFHSPFSWAGELAQFTLVWVTFIGASATYKRLEMPAFDMISMKISKKASLFIFKATQVFTILFSGVLVYAGLKISFSNIILKQISPGLEIPMTYPYLAIPVGMFLLLIHAVALLIHYNDVGKEISQESAL